FLINADLVHIDETVSRDQQDVRLRQLRDLIYPRATPQVLLRQFLEAVDWDGKHPSRPSYHAGQGPLMPWVVGTLVARANTLWNRIRDRILAGEDGESDFC